MKLLRWLPVLLALLTAPMALGQDNARESELVRAVELALTAHGEVSNGHFQALRNLVDHYERRGEMAKALVAGHRALALLERVLGPDHWQLESVLLGLAEWHASLRQYDQMLPLLRRAHTIIESDLHDRRLTLAKVRVNLAYALFQTRGDDDEASQFFAQGVNGLERAGMPQDAASLAKALAWWSEFTLARRRDAVLATELAQRSADLVRQQPDASKADLAWHLFVFADAQISAGAVAAATRTLTEAEQALSKAATSDTVTLAGAHLRLASLYRQLPDGLTAIKHAEVAATLLDGHVPASELPVRLAHLQVAMLRVMHRFDAPDEIFPHVLPLVLGSEAESADQLVTATAQAILSLGYKFKAALLAGGGESSSALQDAELDLAILWGKQAANTFQGVRDDSSGLDADLVQSARPFARWVTESVATLLIRRGRIAEAQQILQMIKEYELGEAVRSPADDPRQLRAGFTGSERQQLTRFTERRAQLTALAFERARLWPQQVRDTQRVLAQIAAEMRQLNTDRVVQNSPSAVTEAAALQRVVNQLATTEPAAQAVAIQYLVSRDTLSIVLTAPGRPPVAYQRTIDRARFYENLKVLALQLQKPSSTEANYGPSLREMHGLLIKPVEPELKRLGARTLMLSLDDRLRLIPFAALQGPSGCYLVEDYALALYNEAAGQALAKPGPRAWQVAAMGLSDAVDGLDALSEVPDELQRILKAPGVRGNVYLNRDFTRARLLGARQAGTGVPHNVLHVASHFLLRPGSPADSALYLGDKSRLTLTELAQVGPVFAQIDLVIYSACQTGVGGGRDTAGTEMESLSARTQRQGAQSVLASLWKVADVSTSRLMESFYNARGQQPISKAEALRQTQLAFIRGDIHAQNGKTWQHPFFWAAFVMAGNWR